MESSEDDAGAATNASRRESAREKDIGHIEDVDATASSQQGSSQCGASSENLAMSEDNFDGDSVPSPSAQDVNTSTEAILDMIDEIVDGPGAPKRLPHRSVATEDDPQSPEADNHCTDHQHESVDIGSDDNTPRQVSPPATSAKSEIVIQESISNIPVECTSQDDTLMATVNISVVEMSQTNSSVLGVHEVAESTQFKDIEQPTESNLAETSNRGPFPNIPSSTVSETFQNIVDNSEYQIVERTVKCITSSDNCDEVTVESAESTSSDYSVNKSTTVEVVTRSPLRRRLVRPAPSDRRPDTTVSSTVDSQTGNIHTTGQTSSESITKDVSSSSDAVPLLYGNVKEEEIRNVSEISVCKAETSMSPKKIKLVRQKVTPSTNFTDNIILPLDNDQCQASSSNNQPESCIESSNTITTSKLINEENGESSKDCVSNESPVQIAQPVNECVDKLQECEKIEQIEQDVCLPKTEYIEVSKENVDLIKVAPIKLSICTPNLADPSTSETNMNSAEQQSITGISSGSSQSESESKQVPKLTIKLGSKQSEDIKSPIPKLTIKPVRPSADEKECRKTEEDNNVPCITKLNIKPILKPPEKINDVHRKSSSSEISESESSENDESTSTSDQASVSDQGTLDVVPKVTIKLGKPGTESEGKFYTEKNVPKLTIKGIQQNENEQESGSKLKLVISQPEDSKQLEKVPKLTIKTVNKSEGQPLSPKLTIKPLKPPDNKESIGEQSEPLQIPKHKISTESYSSIGDVKENTHVPKITIKPITKTDPDYFSRTPKKSTGACDSPEHMPIVTKLNIKPILKPVDSESSGELEEKIPVLSKLNIKPIINPKDNEVDSSIQDIPRITKLNIKPLKSPEGETSVGKDCDELNANDDEKCIPVVTKLNIKPIVKPIEEEAFKDTENQSSETGNSSDDNADLIPVITKLNIKPIIKPNASEELKEPNISNVENIPVVTKLNIKPIIKPEDHTSPKRDHLKNVDIKKSDIPVVTKLNIKPVLKPNEIEQQKSKENLDEILTKNPPLVMKINMKAVSDITSMDTPNSIGDIINSIDYSSEHIFNNTDDSKVLKLNIKPISKPFTIDSCDKTISDNAEQNTLANCEPGNSTILLNKNADNYHTPTIDNLCKNECVPDLTEGVSSTESTTQHNEQLSSNIDIIKSATINDDIIVEQKVLGEKPTRKSEIELVTVEDKTNKIEISQNCDLNESKLYVEGSHPELKSRDVLFESIVKQIPNKQQVTIQNCTLLKRLLENKKEESKCEDIKTTTSSCSQSPIKTEMIPLNIKDVLNYEQSNSEHSAIDKINSDTHYKNTTQESPNDRHSTSITIKLRSMQDICKETNENVTKPLEINVSDKVTSNQSSGQDSPRIILKINKTDHGPSAKIITDDVKRPDHVQQNYTSENNQEMINDRGSPKKNLVNSKKKTPIATPILSMGKRLRSSRIIQEMDKSPLAKRSPGKRPSSTETTTTSPQKESELSVLETKRLKLGQLLSTKSLTITPVAPKMQQINISHASKPCLEIKQSAKSVNHSLLNNENCSKNGNSKLHNILSNLHAKQMKSKEIPFSDVNCSQKVQPIASELECNTSTGSSDVVEIIPVENSHPELQEMIINESFQPRDFNIVSEEMSKDPLEVDNSKNSTEVITDNVDIPKPVEMTPQPKKRGRPRKLPVSEGAKPIALPIPALEERPQRSLRLSRDRPTILVKPRGRGRGRGAKRRTVSPPHEPEPIVETANKFFMEEKKPTGEIDPTSSRIKLPRMTEALDKMPSVLSTPLSSIRRSSTDAEVTPELKVLLENTIPNLEDSGIKSPETPSYSEGRGRGKRGGRGSRGGRGRPPGRSLRGRGRGRGGGRGAMYMKETMGIYGRVCGPATTTVQLFEEETCMMDDNATPAKPSHLLDEDSQSSVKSSTNESSKMKKSKFADLFDSKKVWTAADVKEYVWPPPEKPDVEHQVMMVQEQVAMFLGVKSFKRRYPELKRRTIVGEERDYVLSRNLVTEALCDLGITAVDASEVLDIMLSDYPHKYEEYRSHQRERQLTEASSEETTQETKIEVKTDKEEVKPESVKPLDTKPEPPKIDPEKTRQDMAAAAISSASEWNTRLNASRRPACVDLQTLTVQRRRAPLPPPRSHVTPPVGLYPHALLPGQYQHWYRVYTPEQLRYFPLNTALAAPPAPLSPADSGSDSDPGWGSRSSSSDESIIDRLPTKRKKLTKVKRNSQPATEGGEGTKGTAGAASEGGEADVCRTCGLREEGNRKYACERFLVCANCNAKLHPSCSELNADTVRKCREYAWQCAECKWCCACRRPADDDKMLFCDLCDRGFHIYCVGLDSVPTGRWHCVECAICKSCGTRDPSGPAASTSSTPASSGTPYLGSTSTPGGAEWHHQTRRGPGGHKLYSHSLCTPCARAYRIGRYCPLCERSFVGPKGTMQLVICKLCDRQLHQECVRQTVSALNVLDYTCAECRRGGITSRAAAARLAPRTIATLFMAKRRFNKYAHRQYMLSRQQLRDAPDDASDPLDAADPLRIDAGD